jgi:hypothetical protein
VKNVVAWADAGSQAKKVWETVPVADNTTVTAAFLDRRYYKTVSTLLIYGELPLLVVSSSSTNPRNRGG